MELYLPPTYHHGVGKDNLTFTFTFSGLIYANLFDEWLLSFGVLHCAVVSLFDTLDGCSTSIFRGSETVHVDTEGM